MQLGAGDVGNADSLREAVREKRAELVTIPRAQTRSRPLLVCVCPLPPPVHGSSVMAQRAIAALTPHFDLSVFAHRQNPTGRTIGSFGVRKVVDALALIGKLLLTPSVARADLAYVMPAVDGFAFWRDFIICEVLRWRRLPRVLHMHAKGVADNCARSTFYRFAAKRMFNAAHVIHLSRLLYDDLKDVSGPDHLHVVENGVPEPEASPAVANLNGATPTIFFLSNLMRSKGPLDLLAASRRLIEKGVEHRLVFAGSGFEADVAAEIGAAAQGLPHVTWHDGVYEQAQLTALWAEADIFALPTRRDCQPLVVIEAMARRKAIVTTSEGSLGEMLEDGVNALVVPSDDVNALARALETLLRDPQKRLRLGSLAHDRYREKYALPLFQSALVDTLRRILGTRREISSRADRVAATGGP